jgi:hypothetical protein
VGQNDPVGAGMKRGSPGRDNFADSCRGTYGRDTG